MRVNKFKYAHKMRLKFVKYAINMRVKYYIFKHKIMHSSNIKFIQNISMKINQVRYLVSVIFQIYFKFKNKFLNVMDKI